MESRRHPLRRLLPRALLAAALLAAGGAQAGADVATPPLESAPEFDPGRYVGTWHEIARLPTPAEKHCVAAITSTWTRQADGSLAVRNACTGDDGETIVATGVARVDADDEARLEVRFAPNWLGWVPFVWADYWILAVDEDYRWAIVGEPDRKYLWFLSRDPSVDAALMESLKGRARSHGYDLDPLIVNPPP